jgi:hypothetical protein
MTKFIFLANLVKEVGRIFKPTSVAPDCVRNDNTGAAADDGHFAAGGLVTCSKAFPHFHLPTGCGSGQLVRRVGNVGGAGSDEAVSGGRACMRAGAKCEWHCIVSAVKSHGGERQE